MDSNPNHFEFKFPRGHIIGRGPLGVAAAMICAVAVCILLVAGAAWLGAGPVQDLLRPVFGAESSR